jgi:hypothetical protein
MWLKRVAIALAVVAANSAEPLRADCIPTSIQEVFESSRAVFLGTVTSLDVHRMSAKPFDVQTTATFKVERRWKGSGGHRTKVRTPGGGNVTSSLGVRFQVGSTYVVFAAGKPLRTSSCTRTALAEESATTLEWLRARSAAG